MRNVRSLWEGMELTTPCTWNLHSKQWTKTQSDESYPWVQPNCSLVACLWATWVTNEYTTLFGLYKIYCPLIKGTDTYCKGYWLCSIKGIDFSHKWYWIVANMTFAHSLIGNFKSAAVCVQWFQLILWFAQFTQCTQLSIPIIISRFSNNCTQMGF